MTLRMLDSITVADLPAGAPCYAGYVDGDWATWDDLVARFPHAHLLSIAVFAADDADCLDVENGDATIAQVYGWFVRQQDRGVWRPCIYTSAANLTALLDTMAANGFGRSSFRIWSAHYDAGKHICGPSSCGYPAADGTQWRDDAPGVGGAWVDESLLLDSFFPAPKPKLHPHARSGDTMLVLANGAGAVTPLPVPTAVLTAAGTIAPPTVLRFTTNAPAALEVMFSDSGSWVPCPIDKHRSPVQVALNGAAAAVVQRTDAGANLVVADFA